MGNIEIVFISARCSCKTFIKTQMTNVDCRYVLKLLFASNHPIHHNITNGEHTFETTSYTLFAKYQRGTLEKNSICRLGRNLFRILFFTFLRVFILHGHLCTHINFKILCARQQLSSMVDSDSNGVLWFRSGLI